MTDNDALLRNREAERSLFGYTETLRDSQALGNVKVVDCTFAMPKDTVKKRHGLAYELKPTTDKLSSSIRSNLRSFAVPFRNVWKYNDEFISKGTEFIQNGGFNTPYIQTLEGQSNLNLPTFNIAKIFGYLLAGAGNGALPNPNRCLKHARKGNAGDFTGKFEGNRQSWNYGFFTAGRYTEKAGDSYRGAIPLWWTPRIVKDGVKNSFLNHGTVYPPTGQTGSYNNMSTSLPDIVDTAFALGLANVVPATVANPVLCITQTYSKIDKKVYYYMYWANGSIYASNPSSPIAVESSTLHQWTFSVDTETDIDNGLRYGKINFNEVAISASNWTISHAEGTYSPSDNKYFPLYVSSSLGSTTGDEAKIAFNLACVMLFNNADTLGLGSLCESLGVNLFERINYYAPNDYTGSVLKLRDHFNPVLHDRFGTHKFVPSLDFSFFVLNQSIWREICTDDFKTTICTLPFYAYQKCISDRFLLRHETLSNNIGETSVVDYDFKYDSPYFRNNMVPTMSYFHNLGSTPEHEDDKLLYVRDADDLKWCYIDDGTDEESFTLSNPEIWHYTRSINEFLTIFFSRNALLQMDVFTKIWQRENHNIQNLLDSENYGVVDNTGRLQVKKFLLAHAFTKMVRLGGIDQSAEKVLEDIYGINDVPTCHNNVILLNERHYLVKTDDVLNSGGATDENGNPLALGEKRSVVSDTYEISNDYNCFCPEYSFLITLHWFDAEVIRANVPNFSTNRLGALYSTRKAFQIAFYPLFQSLGDEALYMGDIEFGRDYQDVIGWTNKNNLLKDSDINRIQGEWLGKYQRQLVSATTPWKSHLYAPSLTYGYLQPMSFQYNLPLVDRFGDAILCSWKFETYKKSCMTKSNIVGL